MEHSPRIAILVAHLSEGAASCLASLAGQRGFREEDLFLASGTDWAETLNRAWRAALASRRDYDAFVWVDEDLALDNGVPDCGLLTDSASETNFRLPPPRRCVFVSVALR